MSYVTMDTERSSLASYWMRSSFKNNFGELDPMFHNLEWSQPASLRIDDELWNVFRGRILEAKDIPERYKCEAIVWVTVWRQRGVYAKPWLLCFPGHPHSLICRYHSDARSTD
jgi:hypothetical protein